MYPSFVSELSRTPGDVVIEPYSFLEHLKEGTKYEMIVFPDAFEIPQGSWAAYRSAQRKGQEEVVEPSGGEGPLITPPHAGCSSGFPLTRTKQSRLWNSVDRRISLQRKAGQMLVQFGKSFAGNSEILAQHPSRERRRREEVWSIISAKRLASDMPTLMRHAEHRMQCLDRLRDRKEQRWELERAAGTGCQPASARFPLPDLKRKVCVLSASGSSDKEGWEAREGQTSGRWHDSASIVSSALVK